MNPSQLKKPVTPGAMWGKWGKWGRWHLPSPSRQARVPSGGGGSRRACILRKDEGRGFNAESSGSAEEVGLAANPPTLDTGSGAATPLTVASSLFLLLSFSSGAPLWCHNCLQTLFADWYFASVQSSDSSLCQVHPWTTTTPTPAPSHRRAGPTDWDPFPQILHFCRTTGPLWMEGGVWSHRS